MSQPTSSLSRPTLLSGDEANGQARSSEPELLSMLPKALATSPGFIAGIVVVECLYALVLLAVMSGRKKAEPEIPFEPEPYSSAMVSPKGARPSTPVPVDAQTKANPGDVVKIGSGPGPSVPKNPPPKEPPGTPVVKAANKAAPKSAASKTAAVKGAQKPGAGPTTVAMLKSPNPTGPGTKPGTTKAAPPPKAMATIEPLGPLIDPKRDCQARREGNAFEIIIPPGPHVTFPDGKTNDSPRALTEVNGDFTIQVKIGKDIRPGTDPLKSFPFVFQGAGILLWQDPQNYVRFERAVLVSSDMGSVHHLLVENCTDGRPGKGAQLPVRDAPLVVRLERRGNALNCTYSSDGKSWLPVKKFVVPLASRVNVGISASNASPREFRARFEDLSLNRGSGKSN
jgi:regulation of enolase protein 1 (concanavalin A-like superfamily)